jgi:hypothetical protein
MDRDDHPQTCVVITSEDHLFVAIELFKWLAHVDCSSFVTPGGSRPAVL